MDFYGFYMGSEFEAYQYLGAHMLEDTTTFRTFAPEAVSIAVIGEFTDWKEVPMHKTYDGNFWECTIPNTQEGQMYKYRITGKNHKTLDHCDPYAFYAEFRPGTASRLYRLDNYKFEDEAFRKKKKDYDHAPLNIYELHAGGFKQPEPGNDNLRYTYRELAARLIPYLTENGYNCLELMPVSEYPCDESWGYQTTGFFAPTSRYGAPDDLRFLIDACHKSGISVIFDFVAVHFASNDYGLLQYDGTPLYEYPNSDVGYSEWGTCNFMHSRGEVRSFLSSSVYYWLKEFHFDGIRMDAVSNLIYWQGNMGRGENQSAISFVRSLNTGIKQRCPDALLIAEDSSSYPGVTKPAQEGGLGFDYKWDLGWMNDTLSYMKIHPADRKHDYHKLTFSMQYYYNEKYVMPLSHDEVVHGKATIVQKMNGADLEGKFLQARLLYMYMYAHPGKKLNFMGNELGGPYEWSEKKELDWWLLKDPADPLYRQFHSFMKKLSRLYLDHPAFYEHDYEREGFEWTDCQNEHKTALYSFVRRSKDELIFSVFNFDDADAVGYTTRITDAMEKDYSFSAKLLLSSNEEDFAKQEKEGKERIEIKDAAITLDIPRITARYYLIVKKKSPEA